MDDDTKQAMRSADALKDIAMSMKGMEKIGEELIGKLESIDGRFDNMDVTLIDISSSLKDIASTLRDVFNKIKCD